MTATHFAGPVMAGTKPIGDPLYNQGPVELSQFGNISFDTTLVQNLRIDVPPGSRLNSFTIDVLTAFNSATSATLSCGTSNGATTYVSGVNVKAATGRIAITYTAAQLAKMSNQSVVGVADLVPGDLHFTITSVGQPTAGYVTVRVNYNQL